MQRPGHGCGTPAGRIAPLVVLNNISGVPIEMVRWGTSGLALLTLGGTEDVFENGLGMLYLIQDASFVSSAPAIRGVQDQRMERVERRWKPLTVRERLDLVHRALYGRGNGSR